MQNPKISIPKYQISKEESRDRLRSSPLTSHGHGHKTRYWPCQPRPQARPQVMAISLGQRNPGHKPRPQAPATSQATSHGHQPQAHKPWPKILNIRGCAWGKPAGRRTAGNPLLRALKFLASHKNRTVTKPSSKCLPHGGKASALGSR